MAWPDDLYSFAFFPNMDGHLRVLAEDMAEKED